MIDILSVPSTYQFGFGHIRSSFHNLIFHMKGVQYHCVINKTRKPLPEIVKYYEINKKTFTGYKLGYFRYAAKIAKNENIQLQHPLSPFYLGNIFPIRPRIPLILTVEVPHGLFNNGIKQHINKFGSKLKKLSTQHYSLKNLNAAECIVAVNKATKDYYSKYVDENKITVIPHGVDDNDFKYTKMPYCKNILFVGSMTKRKGLKYLLDAYKNIIKEQNVSLHVVNWINSKPITNSRPKNVFFYTRPSRNELINLYKSCSIFCHPSLAEGFSFPILEAMATGRPVICTDTYGSKIIDNGKDGFVVEKRNSNAIEEKLRLLLSDEKLMLNMGRNGRKKIEAEYSWEIIQQKYYKLYKKHAQL